MQNHNSETLNCERAEMQAEEVCEQPSLIEQNTPMSRDNPARMAEFKQLFQTYAPIAVLP